ncbi:MAG: ABC transporter permease [Phycisphaeraceae bacterium]
MSDIDDRAQSHALKRHGGALLHGLGALGPVIGLVFAWGLFAALAGWDFMQWNNQRLLLLQTVVVGTAAIGATVVIISGSIDLSVGSMIALGTMILALLLNKGAPPWVAGLGSVLSGVVVGAFVGVMVVGWGGRIVALLTGAWGIRRLPLSSFIVTLGMLSLLRGAAKGVGDNQPIYPEATWLNGLMRTGESGLTALLPPGVWILLVLAVLAGAMLRYTRFGRHVFAVGSNEQTARLCGVPVGWVRLRVFMLALACAGLASVFQYAKLGMGDPTTAEGYELQVIAACVIGGASLAGGAGSIAGSIVGALIMTIVDNGCTKLEMDNWVQEIVTGGIIIFAVLLDQLRQARP